MRQFFYFVENVTIPKRNTREYARRPAALFHWLRNDTILFAFCARMRKKLRRLIFSAKMGVSWQKLYGLQVYNTAS